MPDTTGGCSVRRSDARVPLSDSSALQGPTARGPCPDGCGTLGAGAARQTARVAAGRVRSPEAGGFGAVRRMQRAGRDPRLGTGRVRGWSGARDLNRAARTPLGGARAGTGAGVAQMQGVVVTRPTRPAVTTRIPTMPTRMPTMAGALASAGWVWVCAWEFGLGLGCRSSAT